VHASIAVFSLARGRPLLERVCARLGVAPGAHEEREFEDGEHKIRPLERVRGRDVYVVESLFGDERASVNDVLVRVLLFLAALRDAGAARLTAVTPYLAYARKDRRTKPRDPVSTRYLAQLFEAVGVDVFVTVDVHNLAAFQNAFRIPTVHLSAAAIFAEQLGARLAGHEIVVVSPDAGGVKRAEAFRAALAATLERAVGLAFIEKFRSEGVVWGGAVVGEVEGRVAIILDDLVSSGTTLARAAAACRAHGARSVYAAVTHGVLSGEAGSVLASAEFERLLVLDTIPLDRHGPPPERLEILDCAPLLATAIERLHGDGSLIELMGY
jgi:ribose-phosphate pyrophosphokinase